MVRTDTILVLVTFALGSNAHESTGPNFVGFNNDFGVEGVVSKNDDFDTFGIVQSNNALYRSFSTTCREEHYAANCVIVYGYKWDGITTMTMTMTMTYGKCGVLPVPLGCYECVYTAN